MYSFHSKNSKLKKQTGFKNSDAKALNFKNEGFGKNAFVLNYFVINPFS